MIKHCLLIAITCALSTAATLAADLLEANADYLSKQGFSAYQRASYSEAIKLLSARAKLLPADANVFYYLGDCYLKTNQPDQAAHMYSTCIRLAPASAAGKCALKALEDLPHTLNKAASASADEKIKQAQASAVEDSLLTQEALDKRQNDAITRIASQRQTIKSRIDNIWAQLADELQALSPRNTPNYAAELERVRREAENKVEDLQTKELRYESRMMAPDKIDVRAVPQKPQEKNDNTKSALGSLYEYYKPEKPFDPFAADLTPEMIAKFMSIRDVFGELSTYQPAARKIAKQVFTQLKQSIETRQNNLDQQIFQIKAHLIQELVTIKTNAGNTYATNTRQMTAAYHLSASTIPRADNEANLTQSDKDLSDTVEHAAKSLKELECGYYRDVDSYIAGAKERLGAMVTQAGQMNSQLKKPSGTIQLMPLGSDCYTHNYVNFGERDNSSTIIQPLQAQAKRISAPRTQKR